MQWMKVKFTIYRGEKTAVANIMQYKVNISKRMTSDTYAWKSENQYQAILEECRCKMHICEQLQLFKTVSMRISHSGEMLTEH